MTEFTTGARPSCVRHASWFVNNLACRTQVVRLAYARNLSYAQWFSWRHSWTSICSVGAIGSGALYCGAGWLWPYLSRSSCRLTRHCIAYSETIDGEIPVLSTTYREKSFYDAWRPTLLRPTRHLGTSLTFVRQIPPRTFPSFPLQYPSLPLEVGPLNTARGYGGALQASPAGVSQQGAGRSPSGNQIWTF